MCPGTDAAEKTNVLFRAEEILGRNIKAKDTDRKEPEEIPQQSSLAPDRRQRI